MDTKKNLIISLKSADCEHVKAIGSKAKNLAICDSEGFKIPNGFCLTTESYDTFVKENRLDSYIDWEITRKPFEDLRWEEIWDSSLRIRLSFLKAKFPKELETSLKSFLSQFDEGTYFSVRSSSPDEDSREYSFAGIHESFVNVCGEEKIIEKIKLVWASLWSDKSLLYRKEHSLDSLNSSMAVVVQVMEPVSISGLVFTKNPSNMNDEEMVIESIYGGLHLLVDNDINPDRVLLDKSTGLVKTYKAANKENLLSLDDISRLYEKALELENIFKTPLDIEWTGLGDDFTVLQVRPITSPKEDSDEDRKWYLTLTPKGQNLVDLTKKVQEVLIPKLQAEGEEMAKICPKDLSLDEFLDQLSLRGKRYEYWLKVYWDDFIPLAHGIRNFGVFYNDLLSPNDPYEFVNLLKNQSLLAYERDDKMKDLSLELTKFPLLQEKLLEGIGSGYKSNKLLDYLNKMKEDLPLEESLFINSFLDFLKSEMNVIYDNTKLESTPEVILNIILKLSKKLKDQSITRHRNLDSNKSTLKYLKTAKAHDILEQAEKWLMVGQVSWKLRDDDNILLGRLENQLLTFIEHGVEILKSKGKKINIPKKLILDDWKAVQEALVSDGDLYIQRTIEDDDLDTENIKSRQLMGQPSSAGVYTGTARVITSLDDFKEVKNGEVLVFDSVQPQMTFIISLAGAIIERRGGMLVHSSIIAREMNIPSVNGVANATSLINTGDTVTVNGDLGIVIVGEDSFEI